MSGVQVSIQMHGLLLGTNMSLAIKLRSIFHVSTGLPLRANMCLVKTNPPPPQDIVDLSALNALVLNPDTTLKLNRDLRASGRVFLKPLFAQADDWGALWETPPAAGAEKPPPKPFDPALHGHLFIPLSPRTNAFTIKMAILETFVRRNAPVVLHPSGTIFPANVDAYINQAVAINTTTSEREDFATLLRDGTEGDSSWHIESPLSTRVASSGRPGSFDPAVAPMAYVTVRPSTDIAWLNHTDMAYWMLYPYPFPAYGEGALGFGWASVSLRINNDNGRIVSVLFNGVTT